MYFQDYDRQIKNSEKKQVKFILMYLIQYI